MQSNIERGRQLVEQGVYRPDGMVDCLAVIAYHKSQRLLVSETGRCAGNCECDHIEHRSGMLCPHTWESCKSVRVSEIVSLFSRIN